MQSNLQPPNHHFNQYFECVKNKWNTNQEIADILYAAQSDPLSQCITSHILVKPNSGTQIIFPRYDGAWFKNDEFVWRRRREGKLVREDHMKLKIHKQQVISANYVHSAICPTFHRRVYWLTHSPAYVLVHYLNESNAEKGIRKTAEIIADCMHANNIHQLTHQQLTQQLVPIYAHCLKPEEVQVLTSSVLEILQNLQQQQTATSSTPANLPTSSNSPHFQLERRNSCSSASFRRGLSSMALRRQPSANSEIDANYIGTMMKKYGCVTIESSSASPPEKSSCQNCRVATPRGDVAMPSRSPSGDDATSEISTAATSAASKLAAIVAISPLAAKPGDEILVIGPWYLKGHSYDVAFGQQQVPARLIQAGVLAATVPPAAGGTVSTVPLRVYCNNLMVSMSKEFGVILEEEESERVQRRKVPRDSEDTVDASTVSEEVLYQILEKLRILAYALGVYEVWEQISPTFTPNESTLTNLVHQIHRSFVASTALQTQITTIHHQLLGDHQSPAKTLLHHVAQLDFDLLFEAFIQLSSTIPGYHREFDVLARDSTGSTPLHQAARQNSTKVAKAILTLNANAIDVLDDRGRTPADVLNPQIFPVNATELWVLTNGETVTREHLLLSKLSSNSKRVTASCSSFGAATDFADSDPIDQNLHVEISMDTDVHVPDSPKMARLFHVVTSPGIHVTDMARAKMADLARQIIEALPARIKRGPGENPGTFFDADVDQVDFGAQHNPMLSSSGNSMDSSCHQFYDMMVVDQQSTTGGSVDTSRFTSSFDKGSFSESETLDFDKDLGEFFTIHLDAGIDPIQIRLANLKYNDDEQRDVYEAAMVIQRAYREYRARNTSRRQEDLERRAALKIQGCYRRYKQFCYFKKLHNAAIVVQKHFRMRKRGEADASGDAATEAVPEHPTLDGHAIRIQVPQTNSSLSLREHRAATTIQLAYRGHRKRQAAARKIQNFMRQSRNKLRKMHAQNDDVAPPIPASPNHQKI